VTNAIDHGQDSQPESQSYPKKTDAELGKGCVQDGCAAASKNQPKRSDKFSRELFREWHFKVPFMIDVALKGTKDSSR
jgi:hypothetical protein